MLDVSDCCCGTPTPAAGQALDVSASCASLSRVACDDARCFPTPGLTIAVAIACCCEALRLAFSVGVVKPVASFGSAFTCNCAHLRCQSWRRMCCCSVALSPELAAGLKLRPVGEYHLGWVCGLVGPPPPVRARGHTPSHLLGSESEVQRVVCDRHLHAMCTSARMCRNSQRARQSSQEGGPAELLQAPGGGAALSSGQGGVFIGAPCPPSWLVLCLNRVECALLASHCWPDRQGGQPALLCRKLLPLLQETCGFRT